MWIVLFKIKLFRGYNQQNHNHIVNDSEVSNRLHFYFSNGRLYSKCTNYIIFEVDTNNSVCR